MLEPKVRAAGRSWAGRRRDGPAAGSEWRAAGAEGRGRMLMAAHGQEQGTEVRLGTDIGMTELKRIKLGLFGTMK